MVNFFFFFCYNFVVALILLRNCCHLPQKIWLIQFIYNPVIKCLINDVCKSENKNYFTAYYKNVWKILYMNGLLHI